MLTRFGILGDVHQEDERLRAALRHFEGARVERVLCSGDLVDGPGDAARTLQLLRAGGVECVMGNHDRWLLTDRGRDLPDALPPGVLAPDELAFLASLPKTRTYATPAGTLLLCHGMGENDMGALAQDDYGYALDMNDDVQRVINGGTVQLVAAGHTHQRMSRTIGGVAFINAGTLLSEFEPSFAVVDVSEGFIEFIGVAAPSAPVASPRTALWRW